MKVSPLLNLLNENDLSKICGGEMEFDVKTPVVVAYPQGTYPTTGNQVVNFITPVTPNVNMGPKVVIDSHGNIAGGGVVFTYPAPW